MPKEASHIPSLQAKREAKKQLAANLQPGKISLHVIGNGCKGSPKSLYLYTDHNKYIFNCGEGTQRLAQEHRVKLAKLENVFLTHLHWNATGGLPGVCLTVQDMGSTGVTVHGPPGGDSLFQAASKFVLLGKLKVSHVDCLDKATKSDAQWHYEDNILRIRYVPIKRSDYQPLDHREPPFAENYKRLITKMGTRGQSSEHSPPSPKRLRPLENRYQACLQLAVSYVCSLHPKPGALQSEQCVELGVPHGPLLGQLKAGKDVTLPDGRIIMARDVCLPEQPGSTILVVDCPSEEFLDNFISSPEFEKYHNRDGASQVENPDAVFHFTPEEVLRTEKYRDWMSLFPSSVDHVLLGGATSSTGNLGVHKAQYQMNLLDPCMFPILKDLGMRIVDSEVIGERFELDDRIERVVSGEACLKYGLRPRDHYDWSSVPRINPEEIRNEILQLPSFSEALAELKGKIESLSPASVEKKYPDVLFLGTGSCIPNKTRNVSCILLETGPNAYFMMDCGEGCFGQLVRFFGLEKSDEVLCDLKVIFISHFHADHHLGLIQIIIERKEAFKRLGREFEPLILIAPVTLEAWFLLCSEKFHRLDQDFQILWNNEIQILHQDVSPRKLRENPLYRKMKDELGLEVVTSYAKHCFQAYGITIQHKDGWKLTYSGDTMPAPELIKIGKDCDLLIHEATMEDHLGDEARLKCHSTTSQAIEVGRQMGAKFTLLTHFSQRYAKLPIIPDGVDGNVGFAFDNMRVNLDDLKKLPLFTPCLKLVYQEYYLDMEQKTAKKLLQRETSSADYLEELKKRIIVR